MIKKIIIYSVVYFGILFILHEPFWQPIDTQIAQAIIASRTPAATSFFDLFTKLASTKVIIGFIILISLIFYRRNKLLIAQFVLSFGMSAGIVFIFKNLFQRARPMFSQLHTETSYSFPSGHSNAIATLCGFGIIVAWQYMKSLPLKIFTTLLLLSFIILIGYSRLYLSVHWLTDVLAGFSTAIYALAVMQAFFSMYKKNTSDE